MKSVFIYSILTLFCLQIIIPTVADTLLGTAESDPIVENILDGLSLLVILAAFGHYVRLKTSSNVTNKE